MPLRILHISTRLILGGSQENTLLSCEGQARRGHDVHLAFGPIYGPEGSMLDRVTGFRAEDGRGITTHEIPDLIREIHPIRDRRARNQLQSLIREIRPDVVHTHSSKAGILGRLAAWRASPHERPAIIHTIHGPPFMPVEGSQLARAKTRGLNALYAVAERYAARRCHALVSVADAMTEQFLARGIGRPEQYVTVRSGMETGPFLAPRPGESREEVRAELGLAPDDFVIGTVARLAEHKGHDDLLDALGEELHRNPQWRLLWVGDGWCRDRLLARAQSMRLRDQILITGLITPDRIPAMIRAMDVLVHPSRREGLPRTVPQALLTGVCPIAYDADGTREVCRDMETGRLVPLGDLAGLGDAIRWVFEHSDQCRSLAERGKTECQRAFDAKKMVDELESLYNRALARARG